MPDRIIKESCCISETLNRLTDFEERFWWRLTVNCDDYGRFDARPAVLKSRLFPLSESKTMKDMTRALNSLASVGLVDLYTVDGKPFLQVVTWEKHQRIRAKRSKFPAPDGICCQLTANDGNCVRNPIQSKSNPNPNPNPNAGGRESNDFDLFWNAYPKKQKYLEAKIAFDEVTAPVATLLEAIDRQKKSDSWKKDNGQYIPCPDTWLKGERWRDELPVNGSQGGLGAAEMEAIQRVLAE